MSVKSESYRFWFKVRDSGGRGSQGSDIKRVVGVRVSCPVTGPPEGIGQMGRKFEPEFRWGKRGVVDRSHSEERVSIDNSGGLNGRRERGRRQPRVLSVVLGRLCFWTSTL